MDIDKFIDDNIEEILDNPTFFISSEQNTKENKNIVNIYEGEDFEEQDLEEQDDIIDLQDVHEMLERRKEAIIRKEAKKNNKDPEDPEDHKDHEDSEDTEDPEYYFKFINTYMRYYNDKYNKNENLFSNIADKDKDTNSPLELFFEAIMEFKDLKEKLNIEEIDLLDKYYNSDSEEIVKLMNSYEQVYCLEINQNKKIITISLIICLNYVLVNKIEKWNIFILKSY
jgi:hypothetical protein